MIRPRTNNFDWYIYDKTDPYGSAEPDDNSYFVVSASRLFMLAYKLYGSDIWRPTTGTDAKMWADYYTKSPLIKWQYIPTAQAPVWHNLRREPEPLLESRRIII